MATVDGFSIDVPAVLGIAASATGLTATGSTVAGELGSAVLDGVSFAGIGLTVAGINAALQRQTTAALDQLMRLLGQTIGSVDTAANGYSELDSWIAAQLGGGGAASPAGSATGSTDATYQALRGARTPAEVQRQWQALTAAQQQQLIAAHPRELGALNGIPAPARDQANRSVLGSLTQQARDRVSSAESDLHAAAIRGDDFAAEAAYSRLAAEQKNVASLQAVQTVLNDQSASHYLLGIDTNDGGRWIVAAGNPDTAQHVLTLVPGIRNSLEAPTVANLGMDANNILTAARNAAPGESTSVISWVGYHSPTLTQAIDPSYAQSGAGALQSFQQGLYATHDTATPFTSVVAAHSYGTVLTADAAQAPGGLRTDAIALLDSPGVPAPNAAALGVGHVFASATSNDGVVGVSDFFGSLGANEYHANAMQIGAPLIANPQDQGFHGIDPFTTSFGATRFDSGTGHPGLLGVLAAHSDVFNPA
ncbi:MAG: alpha/beta hydrolase, partial [Jatrophihabitantaceae bacterium]